MQTDFKKNIAPANANTVLAAVLLAEKVINVLDKKCRNGCTGEHYTWVGFQNGNGVECGVDIERLIRQAKRLLMQTDLKKYKTTTDANAVLMDNKNELTPKLFELGWGWYEDWEYHLFIHFGKTQEDFKKDVKSLLIKYGKDYLASEQSWAGANGWIDFIAKKMPELGYQPIEPIRESFFGAYIIEGDEDGDKDWGEVVGEELLQCAIAHNNKIRENL